MVRCGAALACLLVIGCGSGEGVGGPIGPSLEQQRIPASNGQRIAPVNPQAVGTTDPQAVPAGGGGGSVVIGPGEEGCKEFCRPFEGGECTGDVAECEDLCEQLRSVSGPCASAIVDYASCVLGLTSGCDEGILECANLNRARLQSACAGQVDDLESDEAAEL
jgi:hypothetical protein